MMRKMTEICGDSDICEVESLHAACLELYSPFDDENNLDNDIFTSRRRRRDIEQTTLPETAPTAGVEIQINFTVKSKDHIGSFT
jgi:hypothetical protein